MFMKKVAKSDFYHTYPISDVGKVHRAKENKEKYNHFSCFLKYMLRIENT